MAKYSNTIHYNLKTTLDASGLNKLQQELDACSRKLTDMGAKGIYNADTVKRDIQNIEKIKASLNNAFNVKTGMLSKSSLFKDGAIFNDLKNAERAFTNAGAQGQKAFNSIVSSSLQLDSGIKRTSKTIDNMFNSFANTARWGIISTAFNGIRNSVYDSIQYIKELDDSLTQIMLVTDYSRQNMNDYAKQANEAAKTLGSTTTAMTNASLVFAQQGVVKFIF